MEIQAELLELSKYLSTKLNLMILVTDLNFFVFLSIVCCSGYMAPEYAADGLFSVKSDVFSFGILMLEIICGKRSRGFYVENDSPNLVTHVSI